MGVVALNACKAKPVQGDLHATDAESRIAGIVAATASDNPADLPALVDALEDDDPAVRLFAAEALRLRTGMDHGYSAYDPADARAQAIKRWRDELEGTPANAHAVAPEQEPAQP